ncbi:MAG: membrane protein insertion efficiency factor YidD [Cytophagaceae bacterium]|nr:membrane protein insertion efficiency factor YidD [Cytophagaceae bacterium]MBK9510029.1 membrane protein insertion efficiency factor YidD [Cytophagaceae bacterium]MBK9933551.1 membrane protein insertion efficiency factor YidD [Cytophagaceae bacterium]MBL0302735.1 membrane protein insertion efficiency factor YidD [Cytophagaceae bacterium]MBL0325558.1 membrane protein insertion efficiency factor YidD [Cytophagaceae bacterium]
MNFLSKILSKFLILIVRIYQIGVSPYFPDSCRYQPTCSQYMIDSIKEWGVLKGTWLGLKRLASCHPWGGHGWDPVKKNPHKH